MGHPQAEARRHLPKEHAHLLTHARVTTACRTFALIGKPFTVPQVAEASCACERRARAIGALWGDLNGWDLIDGERFIRRR